MVPTMILFGLVLGRWWRSALLLGALIWPALLLVDGVYGVEAGLLGAAAIGVTSTALGVALRQAVLAVIRRAKGLQTAH
jgi:hypothetical protein